MEKRKELIKEVDNLFQFTTTLSVFFITIIDILFRYANSTSEEMGKVELKWIFIVAILLICFLVFKIFKKYFSDRVLKITKFLLFAEIFFFIPPIIIIGQYLNTITSYFGYYSLIISLWSLIILPVLILISLFGFPNLFFRKIKFMLKGTIIENSLSDKSILKKIQIDKTWKDEDWILHSVRIDEDMISELSKYLADGPWYIHLWETGKDEVKVIFKNKIFNIKYSDKSTWKDAVAYGESIGIPEEQLDFPIDYGY
jgi:hypothetical protein